MPLSRSANVGRFSEPSARGGSVAIFSGFLEIDLLIDEIKWPIFSLVVNPPDVFADNAEKHGVKTEKKAHQ